MLTIAVLILFSLASSFALINSMLAEIEAEFVLIRLMLSEMLLLVDEMVSEFILMLIILA